MPLHWEIGRNTEFGPILDDSGEPRFKVVSKLGEGGFAGVYKCIDRRRRHRGGGGGANITPGGREVAVKICPRFTSSASKWNASNIMRDEYDLAAQLDHPNIVKIHEYLECSENTAACFDGLTDDVREMIAAVGDTVAVRLLVMEIVHGRTLLNVMTTRKRALKAPLAEERIQSIMRQLCSAVSYIHAHGIIHADLSHKNIIIDTSRCDNVKLLDFGLSMRVDDPQTSKTALRGTPLFITPEMLHKSSSVRISSGTDVWALAIIAIELYDGGCHPFYYPDKEKNKLPKTEAIYTRIKNLDYVALSEEAKAIAQRVFVSPSQRLSLTEFARLDAVCGPRIRHPMNMRPRRHRRF
jgi:serine/threonine protein kinase